MEKRDKLSLLASRSKSDSGDILISPPGFYGCCFLLPQSSYPIYETWFEKRAKRTWSFIFFLPLLLVISKVSRGHFEPIIGLASWFAVIALLLVFVELVMYRLRIKSFRNAIPGAKKTDQKIKAIWSKRLLIAAASPVTKLWLFVPWCVFGFAIYWMGYLNYASGGTSLAEFVALTSFLFPVFHGIPLWLIKVRLDFKRENHCELTPEILMDRWGVI